MSEPIVLVRLATSDDAEIVGDLIDAMDVHYLGSGNSAGAERARDMVRQAIASREGTQFAIAWLADVPVGVACFAVLRPGHRLQGLIFLKDIYVVPSARSGGVGRAMMRWLAGHALTLGIGRIDLTTDATNTGAARLYDALGGERQAKIMFRFDKERLMRLATGD